MYLLLGKEPDIFDAVIVNDNLEDAYGQLKHALLEVSYELSTLQSKYNPLIKDGKFN